MILGPYTQAQTELLQLRYLDFRTSRRMHSFLTNHWRKSDPQSVDILLFSSIHLSHNDRTGWRFLHVQLSNSSPGCQVFLSLGVFTWENSHRCEFHTGMTFWFRIAFTWWLSHFISRYLEIHFMLIKYTCDSKSQTLGMRYLLQSTSRPISNRNGWTFRVYMIPLRDLVLWWNSRPGTRTGVNSRRGDWRRHDILWWYHVNKYRAMRGNRSELAPGRNSPRCHVNTPLLVLERALVRPGYEPATSSSVDRRSPNWANQVADIKIIIICNSIL